MIKFYRDGYLKGVRSNKNKKSNRRLFDVAYDTSESYGVGFTFSSIKDCPVFLSVFVVNLVIYITLFEKDYE